MMVSAGVPIVGASFYLLTSRSHVSKTATVSYSHGTIYSYSIIDLKYSSMSDISTCVEPADGRDVG